jgi:hypothetical protein
MRPAQAPIRQSNESGRQTFRARKTQTARWTAAAAVRARSSSCDGCYRRDCWRAGRRVHPPCGCWRCALSYRYGSFLQKSRRVAWNPRGCPSWSVAGTVRYAWIQSASMPIVQLGRMRHLDERPSVHPLDVHRAPMHSCVGCRRRWHFASSASTCACRQCGLCCCLTVMIAACRSPVTEPRRIAATSVPAVQTFPHDAARRCRMPLQRSAPASSSFCAAKRPDISEKTISTRRFCCRPAAVALLATG